MASNSIEFIFAIIDKYTPTLRKINSQTSKLKTGIHKASQSLVMLRNRLKSVGAATKKLGRAFALRLTAPILAFGAISLKLWNTQQAAEAQLLTALKGNEDAFKRLKKQASDLQKITIIGDEDIIRAQSLLAAFVKEEEQIKRIMPLVLDLAAAKKMQLANAADLVSKTLGSTTNALSRYGITVEGAVGSTERLEMLAKGLKDAFEGQAEILAKKGLGPLIQLKNILGDIQEVMGGVIWKRLLPLVQSLKELSLRFDELSPETLDMIVKFAALAVIIGPVLLVLSVLTFMLGLLLTPLGGIVTAILAVITVGGLLIANWKRLKDAFISKTVKAFGNLIIWLTETLEKLKSKIKTELVRAVFSLMKVWENLKNSMRENEFIQFSIDKIKILIGHFKTLIGLFGKVLTFVTKNPLGEAFGSLKDLFAGTVNSRQESSFNGAMDININAPKGVVNQVNTTKRGKNFKLGTNMREA